MTQLLDRQPTLPGLERYIDGMPEPERSIKRVTRHADPEWYKWALHMVHQCAKTMQEFTTDPVIAALERRGLKTPDLRAMGSVMRKAASREWIGKTERLTPSNRTSLHHEDIRIWRSLLYD